MSKDAAFFATTTELRAWHEQHHATATELWLGYYKKASGRETITWARAVEEALCFGWIDGKVQRIDESATGSGSRRGGATATGAPSMSRRSPSFASSAG